MDGLPTVPACCRSLARRSRKPAAARCQSSQPAHQDPRALAELDRLSDVFLSNPVANRASRAQGRALLTSVSRSFPQTTVGRNRREASATGHALITRRSFGAVFRALDIDLSETQRAFLFISVRGVTRRRCVSVSSARTRRRSIQTELSSSIERTIDRCGSLAPSEIAQTAPLLDLCQSTHDRLYSRLFQS